MRAGVITKAAFSYALKFYPLAVAFGMERKKKYWSGSNDRNIMKAWMCCIHPPTESLMVCTTSRQEKKKAKSLEMCKKFGWVALPDENAEYSFESEISRNLHNLNWIPSGNPRYLRIQGITDFLKQEDIYYTAVFGTAVGMLIVSIYLYLKGNPFSQIHHW